MLIILILFLSHDHNFFLISQEKRLRIEFFEFFFCRNVVLNSQFMGVKKVLNTFEALKKGNFNQRIVNSLERKLIGGKDYFRCQKVTTSNLLNSLSFKKKKDN